MKNVSTAIIMAGGRGTRMRSDLPKVLHAFRGELLITAPIRAAQGACDVTVVVVGHDAERVKAALPSGVLVAVQIEQRGTGHAVRCALEVAGADAENIVVLPGDHPRVTSESLLQVIAARESSGAALALATVEVEDFEGPRETFADYGRIVRDAEGSISAIVEKKDASDEQKAIREVNVSNYCFRGDWLRENIARLENGNAAGEFYLTDLIAMAADQGEKIVAVRLEDYRQGMGVNTPEQLSAAESA